MKDKIADALLCVFLPFLLLLGIFTLFDIKLDYANSIQSLMAGLIFWVVLPLFPELESADWFQHFLAGLGAGVIFLFISRFTVFKASLSDAVLWGCFVFALQRTRFYLSLKSKTLGGKL